MRKILYSFSAAFALLLLLFTAVTSPVKAQSGELPDLDGYYWWVHTIPDYGIGTHDPEDVSCDESGCSGTLYTDGFAGQTFSMVISQTGSMDDLVHVFDITFADESDEGSGQYGAEYAASHHYGFFEFAYPLPSQTYRACMYGSNAPESVIDWAGENCDVSGGHTNNVNNATISFGGSWQTSPFDFNVDIDWVGILRVEQEPVQMPFDPFCHITITDTVTITDSMGITSTNTITTEYTADSNLVQNYSFEVGNLAPDDWQPVVNGTQTNVPPFYQASTPSLARTGDDSIYNGGTFELWNDLPLVAGGTFVGGFYARCVSGDCTGSSVVARWNSSEMVTASSIESTYNAYTGTQETGGGASWFVLSFDSGEGNVQIDDAFVYPVDEDGNLNCDPAYYPYTEDDTNNVEPGPGGIPIPWGGAGTVCYDCQQPYTDEYIFINYWIAWLGCVIRNLFACSLRIWLLKIENVSLGLLMYLATLSGWVAGSSQAVVNWSLDMANFGISLALAFWVELIHGLSGFSVVVNVYDSTFGLFEAIVNLLISLAQLLLGLLDALVSFAELGVQLLQGIWTAWETPAYGLDQIIFGTTVDGGAGGIDGAMATAGANDAKVYVYTIWGLMAMDKIGYDLYLGFVQYPVLGIIGFTVGKWFLDQMKELMPI